MRANRAASSAVGARGRSRTSIPPSQCAVRLAAGLLVGLALASFPVQGLAARPRHRAVVERVEWEISEAGASVILVVKGQVEYGSHFASADRAAGVPPRAYVDLRPAQLGSEISREPLIVDDRLVHRIRLGQVDRDTVRVTLDLSRPARLRVETRDRPSRLLLHLIHASGSARPPKRQVQAPARESLVAPNLRHARVESAVGTDRGGRGCSLSSTRLEAPDGSESCQPSPDRLAAR
jgi:hypothetical protein